MNHLICSHHAISSFLNSVSPDRPFCVYWLNKVHVYKPSPVGVVIFTRETAKYCELFTFQHLIFFKSLLIICHYVN